MTRARDTAGIIQYNKITVDSNNAVGIGSSIPDCKLDINGGLRVVGVSTFESDIQIGDSIELNIGNSNDLKIYHDGTNSYIKDAGTGILILDASQVQINNAGSTENCAKFFNDGAVELYYDNSKKFQTTGGGAIVTGITTCDGLSLGDSEYAYFGATNDLQIFHNGSHSFIEDTGTGNLYFRSNGAGLIVDTASGSAIMARFLNGNTVDLYYNGAKKFETTNTGVTVTGTASATTFSGSGSNLTSLNASQLSSGTIPDARFPSTLPAVDGSQLTGIVGGTSFDWRDGSLF